MKGGIDMSAVTDSDSAEESDANKESDSEVQDLLDAETNVELFVVDKNKTRSGGAFVPYLRNTTCDLDKYGMYKDMYRNNHKHNCLYLALHAGGLSDIKLHHFILSLRNRTIHECGLSKICNALEINIELISIRTDNGENRVEHYPMHPYVEYAEKYRIGLVKGHYDINDYT